MQPHEFKVAIIGGGIGGLTTALSLAHHCPGLQIDIYEQAAQFREIGAGVAIGVNATKLLYRLGIGEAASAISGKEASPISGKRGDIHRSMRRWDNGGEIVTIPAEFNKGDIRQLLVHRAEFLDVLYQAIKARGIATMHTNKRCVKVMDAKNKVTFSFADGTDARADLLIGCDGIHSQVRAQFVTDDPTYSGRIAYRGLLPLKDVEAAWPFESYVVSWLAPNKHFLVFPVSQNTMMNVVAFVTKSRDELGNLKESWTSTAPRAELEKEYKGWDPMVEQIIKCMSPHPGKWLLNDREPLNQWTFMDGKVVLLGDAAHAMLPHQGSGAGHSIEDAYIIGRCLQDYFRYLENPVRLENPLAVWTKTYQDVRLPRTKRAQVTSRDAGDVYEMQGPDFDGLTFEECLPVVAKKLTGRMRWVWGGDVDAEYEDVAKAARLPN